MPAGKSIYSGKSQSLQGVIRAEDVYLTFPGLAKGDVGALVQQAQITCERSLNMLYEIGSPAVYYVGDRRRGTAQFSRVVGGSKNFTSMIAQFGDICKAKDNHLELEVGGAQCAATGQGVKYKMISATLNTIGASVTAQDIVVTENMGFMFVDLEYN
jgi:hypothetical protein